VERQIGKQCKLVQVHSFSRFSPSVQSSQFASSSGAKNSAGVISKYEMILNSSLRDGKAAPLVIPRMYEPLLSKSKAYLLIKEGN